MGLNKDIRFKQGVSTMTIERPKKQIKEMPDQETLEQFMGQLNGDTVKVVFNLDDGKFEWLREKTDEMLGEPKTEYGRELRRL